MSGAAGTPDPRSVGSSDPTDPGRVADDPARRLRRLRAALGASADALLARANVDAAALLAEEAAFVAELAPEHALQVWRDLRNRALALAADLPPTPESIALLERRLAADERRLD